MPPQPSLSTLALAPAISPTPTPDRARARSPQAEHWETATFGSSWHQPLVISMVAGFTIVNFTSSRKDFLQLLHISSTPVFVAFFTLAGASHPPLARARTSACNPTHTGLQPHAHGPAIPRTPGCNPTPHAPQARVSRWAAWRPTSRSPPSSSPCASAAYCSAPTWGGAQAAARPSSTSASGWDSSRRLAWSLSLP